MVSWFDELLLLLGATNLLYWFSSPQWSPKLPPGSATGENYRGVLHSPEQGPGAEQRNGVLAVSENEKNNHQGQTKHVDEWRPRYINFHGLASGGKVSRR
jgi:hypothetical protein